MIRPFTVITMALAALSGAYLFAVKHRAQVLDDQLASVAQASRLDEQRIRVLQAQWALEIDPTRLTGLAGQFTALQPMKPAQLVTLASLRETLPPAGSPAPDANPQTPAEPADIAQAAPTPADDATQVAMALPMPPPEAPAVLVSAVPSRPPVQRLAARVKKPASRQGGSELAAAWSGQKPLYAARPLAAAGPMGAQVVSVRATPMVVPAQDNGGSALGMAADLAPPQPLPPGLNN